MHGILPPRQRKKSICADLTKNTMASSKIGVQLTPTPGNVILLMRRITITRQIQELGAGPYRVPSGIWACWSLLKPLFGGVIVYLSPTDDADCVAADSFDVSVDDGGGGVQERR